ncbi:MAG: NAD(P)/FAD-dependent oxidoreductase, partial [Bacteroidota bacterium]
MVKNTGTFIVGGGLSGLTLAYILQKQNIQATILEASPRLGGRIQTQKGELDTPLELGATWFSDAHKNLLALLEELGLEKYPQRSHGTSLFQTKSFEPAQRFHVPESTEPSYRVRGGTQTLTDTLAKKIPSESIHLNTKVVQIINSEEKIILKTEKDDTFHAAKVVLCLPPQLVGTQIEFSPPLSASISSILPEVQTWMLGSIKFVIEYAAPFWREKGYSGLLYSHVGPITEMYDHTNFEEDKFGFTGFLSGRVAAYSPEERKSYVLSQLNELLGKEASKLVSYHDKVWVDEFISGGSQSQLHPHQNNGYPLLQDSYFDKKLFFAGTESSTQFSGYMEGAILS